MSLEKLKTRFRSKSIPIPQGVLPSPEEVSAPPKELINIIDRVDRGWARRGGRPRERRQWNDCNMIPDIFCYVVDEDAKRNGYEASAKRYQLLDLHKAAGGGRDRKEAFQHGLNTVTIGDSSYLVDLTFSQFLGSDGLLAWGNKPHHSSKVPNDTPMAVDIIKNGYVPLTDETLREYLRITSEEADKSYIDNMTVAMLDQVEPLPIESLERDGVRPDFGLV